MYRSAVPPTPEGSQPLIVGMAVDPATGQLNVDGALVEPLLDLAESLGELTGLPVDVEHVVGAVLLACRAGDLGPATELAPHDLNQRSLLVEPVREIFRTYDGGLGAED